MKEEKYNKVVEWLMNNGFDFQSNMCIEEMSELTKELLKNKRGEENTSHIIEEIADVENTLFTLKRILNCDDEVSKIKLEKLQRTYDLYIDKR